MPEAKLLRYRSGLSVLAAVWVFVLGLYVSALTFAALQDISNHFIPFKVWYIVLLTKSGPIGYVFGIVRFAVLVGILVHHCRALQEYSRHFVLDGSELRKYDRTGREIGRVDLTQAELPPDLRGELAGTGWRAAMGTIFYTGGHHIVDRNGGAVTVATRYLAEVSDFHEGVRRAVGMDE